VRILLLGQQYRRILLLGQCEALAPQQANRKKSNGKQATSGGVQGMDTCVFVWEEWVTRGAGKRMVCGQTHEHAWVLCTCIIFSEMYVKGGGMEGLENDRENGAKLAVVVHNLVKLSSVLL
jgi:hypothetical protein